MMAGRWKRLTIEPDDYARLQLVQANLLRHWGHKP